MATSIIFWSEFRTFLTNVLKDPSHSCDHFYVKIMVVGGCCVGGNNELLIKKLNKLQFDCDVIDYVIIMSHTGTKSPASEIMVQ